VVREAVAEALVPPSVDASHRAAREREEVAAREEVAEALLDGVARVAVGEVGGAARRGERAPEAEREQGRQARPRELADSGGDLGNRDVDRHG
jgi:hypothetical protein